MTGWSRSTWPSRRRITSLRPGVGVPRWAASCAGRGRCVRRWRSAREEIEEPAARRRLRLVWTQRRRSAAAVGQPQGRGSRGSPDLRARPVRRGRRAWWWSTTARSTARLGRHDRDVRRRGAVSPRGSGVRRGHGASTCIAVPALVDRLRSDAGSGLRSLRRVGGDGGWQPTPDAQSGRRARRTASGAARSCGGPAGMRRPALVTPFRREDGSGVGKPSRRLTNRVPRVARVSRWGRWRCRAAGRGGSGRRCRLSEPRRSTPRSTATASARIDSAISGGGSAPMAMPAGPWTRSRSASVTPLASSHSRRRAWVRRDPIAPRYVDPRCESGQGCLDGRPVDLGVVAGDDHGVGVGERGEGLGQLGGGAALPAQEAGHREQGLGDGAVPDDEQGEGVRHADHASRDR